MASDQARKADHPVDSLFLDRWSPRAFTGESISEADLLTMLEAARWAASSYNAQPWRFLYARRGTAHWDLFLKLLVETNQVWAQHASALVVLVSDTMIHPAQGPAVPSYTHSLDAGAASANFALQATKMGWHIHGMAGFDKERTPKELGVPDTFKVEAFYAVGKQGDKATLPESLQVREQPSGRKPLREMVFEGKFQQ